MSDELIAAAEKHLAADHARDEILDKVRRFAEALASDECAELRAVGTELQGLVGVP
ncbi:hypothetical protein OG874_00105 [Nocardia sp. NBC_00565]|uniref:hypothetical protein n=1 Tax=Nocardia sp. NBC_00565 TaxID=2975993 RepID=UPI002E80ED3A|nr:hypothetical protein [Nocardia sp. NBC_00565]WUC03656.1 hypothetical protein OG874_00105 [Nocardia sp. NBC_00565]